MSDPTKKPNPQDFQKEVNQFVEGAAGLLKSLSEVFLKSREEVVRGAKVGRARLDLFQLKKDRQDFLTRLGEDCLVLLSRGELRHPDLDAGWQRIRAVDEKITEYEREVGQVLAEQAAEKGAPANDSQAPPTAASPPAPADPEPAPVETEPLSSPAAATEEAPVEPEPEKPARSKRQKKKL